MSVVTPSLVSMDVVEVAAVVLAALEVAPSEPADLTPLVHEWRDFDSLARAAAEPSAHPLTRYLARSIDHRRVAHWKALLREDVSENGRYRPVLIGQPEYPRRLSGVWDAPPLLFVRGTLAAAAVPVAAIVGSRSTNDCTVDATNGAAFILASNGVDVVSGLALGVDSAAHRGALRATGRTTAIMGTGIQVVYPSQQSRLADAVSGSGALVSEFPPYAPHTGTSFLRRNGTIAAMCDVLVVMDATIRSGSRQAVRRAIEYGRPVMMWAPTLRREVWANELVDAGQAKFFDEPNRLLNVVQEAT